MGKYKYLITDKYGKEKRGTMEAGSEEAAMHNAFMFSVIESCKMNKRTVEDYLMSLLDKLKLSREGDDLAGLLPCNLAT